MIIRRLLRCGECSSHAEVCVCDSLQILRQIGMDNAQGHAVASAGWSPTGKNKIMYSI